MGQFLGFSDEHYSIVEFFRNLSTGYISLQFHLVFDDLFETVTCTGYNEIIFNYILNYLFELNKYWYPKDEHADNYKLIYQPPPL